MKKYLSVLGALIISFNANAQMTDTLRALAIDGMMNREAYQGIGQMQNALGKINFQQELSELITETQIAALNNHFDKSDIRFNGLQGIDWDVVSVSTGQYYIELKNIDDSLCNTVRNSQWGTHHIDVNEGGNCEKNSNNVKLFF